MTYCITAVLRFYQQTLAIPTLKKTLAILFANPTNTERKRTFPLDPDLRQSKVVS